MTQRALIDALRREPKKCCPAHSDEGKGYNDALDDVLKALGLEMEAEAVRITEPRPEGVYCFYNNNGYFIGALSAQPGCGSDRLINNPLTGRIILASGMVVQRVPNMVLGVFDASSAERVTALIKELEGE